ncbi:MAG: hypothetical protein AB1793_06825 [Candidatus Thermoplasmatota archaeon]
MCNQYSSSRGFTADDIIKCPEFKKRGTKKASIEKALRRFVKLGIATSPGLNSKGHRLYRIKNREWAISYIEGSSDKPWIMVTPSLPGNEFTDYDEHRTYLLVDLTAEWMDTLIAKGERGNDQYTLRTQSFTLTVNGRSRRGQFFYRPYWRAAVERHFGKEFLEYLLKLMSEGRARTDFCLPVDIKGERLTIGGRPTQFGSSHYPAEMDIRCQKSDHNIRDGIKGLVNQADFNVRILDVLDKLSKAVDDVKEIIEKLAESEARTMELLLRLLGGQIDGEYPYEHRKDGGDISYG